jgi:hypothetical protein
VSNHPQGNLTPRSRKEGRTSNFARFRVRNVDLLCVPLAVDDPSWGVGWLRWRWKLSWLQVITDISLSGWKKTLRHFDVISRLILWTHIDNIYTCQAFGSNSQKFVKLLPSYSSWKATGWPGLINRQFFTQYYQ